VLGDDVTAANSDVFGINQGASSTLDVLANDTDASGDGITVVSVSESPNAEISVTEDNEVLYTPDPGYFSQEGQPDTFTYTIEDGNGVASTGNVSVTVVRFSDLNNNALNDFVECNCTDLFLVTGVDGTGIGRISSMTMLVLVVLGFVRRRRRSAFLNVSV